MPAPMVKSIFFTTRSRPFLYRVEKFLNSTTPSVGHSCKVIDTYMYRKYKLFSGQEGIINVFYSKNCTDLNNNKIIDTSVSITIPPFTPTISDCYAKQGRYGSQKAAQHSKSLMLYKSNTLLK